MQDQWKTKLPEIWTWPNIYQVIYCITLSHDNGSQNQFSLGIDNLCSSLNFTTMACQTSMGSFYVCGMNTMFGTRLKCYNQNSNLAKCVASSVQTAYTFLLSNLGYICPLKCNHDLCGKNNWVLYVMFHYILQELAPYVKTMCCHYTEW